MIIMATIIRMPMTTITIMDTLMLTLTRAVSDACWLH